MVAMVVATMLAMVVATMVAMVVATMVAMVVATMLAMVVVMVVATVVAILNQTILITINPLVQKVGKIEVMVTLPKTLNMKVVEFVENEEFQAKVTFQTMRASSPFLQA